MITMLVYGLRRREQENFTGTLKEVFAYLSEERLDLLCFSTPVMIRKFLEKEALLDFACVGVMGQEELVLLHQIRSQYTQAELLLIADASISPMKYLTPDVRAASLLLYPYEKKQMVQVLQEFLRSCLREREQDSAREQDFLVLENREGRTVIPFRQIYYIEVRERKVFIRVKNKEYSKYDSMEHILRQLPDIFVRCHRSFAFNVQHLERVKLSENAVYLEHGIMVPLSRSYKSAMKEYIHGRCAGREE